MKEPWATPNGATHKACYPLPKKTGQFQEKKHKNIKKSKKIFKNPKNKKKLEKLQKTLKTREKESGSEAGAKRERRRERSGRQENHGKAWKNVEIIESASFPLRSRFVPAPFPLQARGVLTLPWSFQCLGAKGCCHGKITRKHASCINVNLRTKKFTKLLPPKNHHETLGVLTLPWSFQYIYIYYD